VDARLTELEFLAKIARQSSLEVGPLTGGDRDLVAFLSCCHSFFVFLCRKMKEDTSRHHLSGISQQQARHCGIRAAQVNFASIDTNDTVIFGEDDVSNDAGNFILEIRGCKRCRKRSLSDEA